MNGSRNGAEGATHGSPGQRPGGLPRILYGRPIGCTIVMPWGSCAHWVHHRDAMGVVRCARDCRSSLANTRVTAHHPPIHQKTEEIPIRNQHHLYKQKKPARGTDHPLYYKIIALMGNDMGVKKQIIASRGTDTPLKK